MKAVSIGKDKAIEMANARWWAGKSPREICDVQLFTRELCTDFSVFHKSLEECLGRPVWTHELGLDLDGIRVEYLGQRDAPTMDDIVALLKD